MMPLSSVVAAFAIVFAALMALSLACVLVLSYGVNHLPAESEQKLTWTAALRGAEKSFLIFMVATIMALLAFAWSAA